MNIAEEYRLSEYQDLGELNQNKKVHLVRNNINGIICVRKILSPELYEIYNTLKYVQTAYTPHVYEVTKKNDTLIVVEEYFAGENLEDALENQHFTDIDAAWIVIELCRCLKILHEMTPPIICRDIKPQNIILTNERQVKLVDFDIARVYQPGKKHDTVMMGTEGYAAPEQFGFGQTDARTDIYGLGVLLNYLLVRKFPVEQIAYGKYTDIIYKCTQMNPDDRYQNVNELRVALENVSGLHSEENIKECRNTVKKSICDYKIPGFRTNVWWKKVIAVIGYFAITLVCFTLEFNDVNGVLLDAVTQRVNQTAIWLSQIAFVLFVCDYRKIQDKIPYMKKNGLTRVVGCIGAYFILILIAAFMCAIIEVFFL